MSDDWHVFIQWKGTDVCLDWYCPKSECPGRGHIDGDFCYAVKCPDCGQVYELGTEVSLSPVDDAFCVYERVSDDDDGGAWARR